VTGRVRSVLCVCVRLSLLIGRGGTSGHDRPDVSGRVRSWWVLIGLKPDASTVASGSSSSASDRSLVGVLLRLDQRVRSVMGPAHPVELRAWVVCDQRVRSV
jgi:hypothetical protein